MRKSGGGTADFGVEDAFSELFYVVDFVLFGDEEAKVGVIFSEFF